MKNLKYIFISMFLLLAAVVQGQISEFNQMTSTTAQIVWEDFNGNPSFFRYQIIIEDEFGMHNETLYTSGTFIDVTVPDMGMYFITIMALDDLDNWLYDIATYEGYFFEPQGGGGGVELDYSVSGKDVSMIWGAEDVYIDFDHYLLTFTNTTTSGVSTETVSDFEISDYMTFTMADAGIYSFDIDAYDIYGAKIGHPGDGSFRVFNAPQFTQLTTTTATVQWEQSAHPDFYEYKIVIDDNSSAYTQEYRTTAGDATETSVEVTSAGAGDYTITVSAINGFGTVLEEAAPVTFTFTDMSGGGGNPTTVTATVSNNTLNINWPATTNTRFDSYKLTITNQSNGTSEIVYVSNGQINTTSYAYTALKDGKYSVQVEAVDYSQHTLESIGTSSSAPVTYYSDNTTENTANVQNLTTTGSQVNLAWNSSATSNPDFSHFRASYTNTATLKTDHINTVAGDPNHKSLTFDVYEKGTYKLKVEAIDKSGNVIENTLSTTITTTDNTPPITPTFAPYKITNGGTKLTIEWSDLSGTPDFGGYKFYHGLASGALTETNLTVNTFNINVAVDNEYKVEVLAYDDSNNQSEKSTENITIYPYETEENFNIANADLVNTKIFANLEKGDEDFFSIQMTSNKRYTFTIETTVYAEHHIESVNMAIYSADGTLLAESEAAENYPELFIDVDTDGKYYVKLWQTDALIQGGYGLSVKEIGTDEYELNNTMETAKALPLTPKDLTLYPTHDNDFYKINLSANQYLKAWFKCDIDATAYIVDAAGNVLHTVKVAPNGEEQLIEYPIYTAGEYYILFNAAAKLQVGTYTMRAEVIQASSLEGKLVINEIYHNANIGFIEIYNNSTQTIALDNVILQLQQEFQFPAGASIAPGEYQVITHNADFEQYFGVKATYVWDNTVMFNYDIAAILKDATENHIDIVPYGIETGWHSYKNFGDKSLELTAANTDNAVAANWHISYAVQGTPLIINSIESHYTADYYEPNNTVEAFKLLYDNTFDLTLSSFKSSDYADTEDWFAYKGETGDQLNIDVTVPAEINMTFSVFDSQMNAIYTYNLQNTTQNIQHTFATDTHLYFKAEALNSEGTYQLSLSSTYPAKDNTWVENFENLTEGLLPAHWIALSNDDDKDSWKHTGQSGVDYSDCLLQIPNSYFTNNVLITPKATLGQRDVLNLYFKNEYKENPVTTELEILTGSATANKVADFTTFKTIELTNTEMQKVSIDLTQFANQTVRFAFQIKNPVPFYTYIDNVSVEKAPPMGNLSGTLTETAGTTKIAGALVEVSGYSATTDANGAFSFTDLSAGVHNVTITKAGYETARYKVEISEFQTYTLSAMLRQYNNTEVYSSETDNGTTGENGALTTSSVVANGKNYTAQSGSSFVVIDKAKNQSRTETYSWSSSQTYAFNLNDIISPKLSFYYQLEDPAVRVTVKVKSLVANLSTTLNFNNNLTSAWEKVVYDLSDLQDNPAYSSCVVEFTVERDVALTKGFGLLLDNVKVYGLQMQKSPVPQIIETYYNSTNHAFNWEAVNVAGVEYKIYRKNTEFEAYTYLGTATATEYVDATSNVNSEYFYSVVAAYNWGDSDFADMAIAVPKKSGKTIIAYSETNNQYYETNFDADNANWTRSMLNSRNNYWQYNSTDGEWTVSGSEKMISETAEILLSSPVFDASNRQHSVIAEFNLSARGNYTQLNVICLYENASGNMEMETIGSISQTADTRYRVDITKHIGNSPYVQLLFAITGNNYQFENSYGYTLDDFYISDIPSGYFTVDVKSTTGVPIKQATVYVPQHGKYYQTNNNGTVTSSLGDYFDGDEITIAVATAQSLTTFVSDPITIEANKTYALSVTLDMQLPQMPAPEIVYNAAESSLSITWDNAMSIPSIGQEVFSGKYNLYRSRNGSDLQLIAQNITATSYTDNTNVLNDKGEYRVAALYNLGQGAISLPTAFEINSLAQIEASLDQSFVSIPYTTDDETVTLNVSNTGKSPLHYNISYHKATEINMADIAINPQYHGLENCVIIPLDEFPQSGEADIRLALLNLNNDNEWLKKVSVTFPNGIEVLSSENFVEPNSGRYLMSNLLTGNGATLTWNNPAGENAPGKIYDGEVAYTTVRVRVSSNFYETPSFVYTLWGDKTTGEWQHFVDKSFTEHDYPVDIDFTPELVTEHHVLAVGASTQHQVNITVNQHINELLPGYVKIESNSLGSPVVDMPLNINLEPDIVTVKVLFLNQTTQLPVTNSEVVIYGRTLTTDADGFVSVDVPDATNISVYADVIDFKLYESFVNSSDLFPVITLTPDLAKVDIQSVDILEKSLTLNWTITENPLSASDLQKIVIVKTDADGNEEQIEVAADATSYTVNSIVPGNYYIEVKAVYNMGTAVTTLGQITMNNDAAVIAVIDNQTIDEDQTLTLDVSVTDTNNQQVAVSASASDTNVNATIENGVLTLTPAANWSGNCTVTILANDGISLTNMQFELIVNSINDLPELQTIPAKDYYTGGLYNFAVEAIDVETTDIAVTVDGLPDWLTYDATAKTITGEVPQGVNGEFSYTINLADTDGGNVDITIEGNVIAENIAPELVSDAVVVVYQNDAVNYQLIVADVNNDDISVTISEIPSWLSYNSDEMTISGTALSAGHAVVKIQLSDGTNTADVEIDFDVQKSGTVVVDPNNIAPVIQPFSQSVVTVGKAFSMAISAYDAEGDELIFTGINVPDWLTISQDGATYCTLSGTLTDENSGSQLVQISVTDGKSLPVEVSFFLQVVLSDIQQENVEMKAKFYPTISENVLYVEFPQQSDKEWNISIFNLNGKLVYAKQALQTEIESSGINHHLSTGSYIIRVHNAERNYSGYFMVK